MVIKLIAALHEIKTMKSGGGRIVLDFGNDSIDAVLQLQKVHSKGELLLAIAISPIQPETPNKDLHEFVIGDLVFDAESKP